MESELIIGSAHDFEVEEGEEEELPVDIIDETASAQRDSASSPLSNTSILSLSLFPNSNSPVVDAGDDTASLNENDSAIRPRKRKRGVESSSYQFQHQYTCTN